MNNLHSSPFSPLDLAYDLIDLYDLHDFFEVARCGHHVWNPYHNMEHELIVMAHGFRLLRPHEVDERMMRVFLVACMFHDHNHFGDVGHDRDNVARSIEALKEARLAQLLDTLIPHAGIYCESIISCTVFENGQFPVEPETYYQKCIRDADLMMVYTLDGRSHLSGLFKEMGGKWLHEYSDTEIKQHLQNNLLFLKNAHMYTDEGEATRNNHLQRAMDALQRETMKFKLKLIKATEQSQLANQQNRMNSPRPSK